MHSVNSRSVFVAQLVFRLTRTATVTTESKNMSKIQKTIFDTVFAKIDKKERASILDKMYANCKKTRDEFMKNAWKITETTKNAKENIAKLHWFADYLYRRAVGYEVVLSNATITSLEHNGGDSIYLKDITIKVVATDEIDAEKKAIDCLWKYYNIEAHNIDICNVEELPVLNKAGYKNFNYETLAA